MLVGERLAGVLPAEHDDAFALGHVLIERADIFAGIHREDGDLQARKALVIGRAEEAADQSDHLRQRGEPKRVQANALHIGVVVRLVVFQLGLAVGGDIVGRGPADGLLAHDFESTIEMGFMRVLGVHRVDELVQRMIEHAHELDDV